MEARHDVVDRRLERKTVKLWPEILILQRWTRDRTLIEKARQFFDVERSYRRDLLDPEISGREIAGPIILEGTLSEGFGNAGAN